nr:hypothetical protein [Tanacetum cinerariifolium]
MPSQPPLSSPSRIPIRQETKVPQPNSPTHTHVANEATSTGVDVRHGEAAITVSSLDTGQGSAKVHTYTRKRRTISTASGGISTTEESVSTAGALMPVSTAGMVDKAVRLQEQLNKEERQRIARVHKEASSFNVEEWEDIQAIIKADEELALRIQAEERKNILKLKKQDCL